ncbi:replication-associated protein [Sewage-associated circular DNA virus-27]|uniref:Replication-associated protein n=1 Tax=Sewage-associated circular DNA virus-27 TaxID=1592094 RepID=A0A0B4UGZ0_9VIRU|nr:replication-associated protein [Sewage-associated circular DNA virus-27]AJD07548.1 replication-associated protein [Sewage-associated circular DNA virus-27]
MERRQGIYWLLTIPFHEWTPYLPPGVSWIRGQLESGSESGYLHWQIVVALTTKCSLRGIKGLFGDSTHGELSRTNRASVYVWKEETRIEGTQFELGERPFKRNCSKDWEQIWECAQRGDLMSIPADVRVHSYRTLRAISADYSKPLPMVRDIHVYIGPTATGKSRRAWDEAGMEAYCKDPNSKFWCGYSGQPNIVLDEYRGRIDVSHLLRWFDRYPVNVEIKGSSVPLCAESFWITTNLDVDQWYPDLDATTLEALRRRLKITYFR